jgi:hypothetical protein
LGWPFALRGASASAIIVGMLGTRCSDASAETGTQAQTLRWVQSVLAHIYADEHCDPSFGPTLTPSEEEEVDASGGSHIYGEITSDGVNILMSWVSGRLREHITGKPWSFVDLGSGVGRMCMQVYLAWGAACATGVELSRTRHEAAERAAQMAVQMGALPPSGNGLRFVCSDLLLASEHLEGGSGRGWVGVYIASLLFDEKMMSKVDELLERSSQVLWVATLQRLPDREGASLRLDGTLRVPMSWGDACVYLYVRKGT